MEDDIKELINKMTPELWSALARLEKGEISHNFRRGRPNVSWGSYAHLETLGLAGWRESGSYDEWEDYWITDKGRLLLKLRREEQDTDLT